MKNIEINKNIMTKPTRNLKKRFVADFKMNYSLYGMMLVVAVWFLLFCYLPMYGAMIAFKDYNPALGFLKSPWVGVKHFEAFFTSPSFPRLMTNTIKISLVSLVFGFPAPIILALLMNEIKKQKFIKAVQNITYLPHFISLVVVCGMVRDFTSNQGVIGVLTEMFGGEAISLLSFKEKFLPVYVVSSIWQEIGWGTIIYLAALTSIDLHLYEAAEIDGAGYYRQMLHITLPGICSTIVVLLVMRMGSMLSVGYEKIILLYNDATMEVADVINTYVYRRGLIKMDFSYSAAIGLFSSVVNILFLTMANAINKKINNESIW